MRDIRYAFSSEEIHQLYENTDYQKANQALGYLTGWNMSYPKVEIYIRDHGTELFAVYRDEDNGHVYSIAGIWNEDAQNFSFHS